VIESRRGLVALAAIATLLAQAADGGAVEARHVIYLSGRIVQEAQSARPEHPQFGYYELEQILAAFRQRGFVVRGDIRPKSASVSDAADEVVARVRALLAEGVPADHVTVVGGSMGATIALLASARLQNRGLRFALLGICLSTSVAALREGERRGPSGRLLAIREASDDVTTSCPPWKDDSTGTSALVVREIVLEKGLRHGFLYRPLPAWVSPVVEWADAASER
jgi:pimeloyl-ACP methyl ester carboxylesterase